MSGAGDDALIAALEAALSPAPRPVVRAKPVPPMPPSPADPDRMPWPSDWTARRDPADATACRRMWSSVLRSALFEVVSGEIQVQSERRQSRPAVDRHYLDTRDFGDVCNLAGLDPIAVRERVLAALACPEGRAAMSSRAAAVRIPLNSGPATCGTGTALAAPSPSATTSWTSSPILPLGWIRSASTTTRMLTRWPTCALGRR